MITKRRLSELGTTEPTCFALMTDGSTCHNLEDWNNHYLSSEPTELLDLRLPTREEIVDSIRYNMHQDYKYTRRGYRQYRSEYQGFGCSMERQDIWFESQDDDEEKLKESIVDALADDWFEQNNLWDCC